MAMSPREEMVAEETGRRVQREDDRAPPALGEYTQAGSGAATLTEEQKQQMATMYTQKNDSAVDELTALRTTSTSRFVRSRPRAAPRPSNDAGASC
jgi:hypothetical protein